jgi:3-methyladenine DNA glycosylase AlkD
MEYQEVIQKLQSLSNPQNIAGMARYGINTTHNLGISIYQLRPLAKKIGKNHMLALRLWNSGIHDARLLACFIDDPTQVTSEQMDTWADDFDSWDICDQACTSLFDQTPYAYKKVQQWSEDDKEFKKRAAFSLIAGLAVHDKNAPDSTFEQFFSLFIKHAADSRNYVKKAVNWALRNIGKRNQHLNKQAIQIAQKIQLIDAPSARWIASDVLRELANKKVQERLRLKKKKINYIRPRD